MSVLRDGMAAEIDGDVPPADDERYLLRWLRPPKNGSDSRQQFLRTERLGEVIVRAHVEGANLVGLVASSADDNHGRYAAAFERGEDMPTIHEGQADVEQ